MGGRNSGRRRIATAGAVEAHPKIHLKLLRNEGLLVDGEFRSGTLSWTIGPATSRAELAVDLRDAEALRLQVRWADPTGPEQQIRMERIVSAAGRRARLYLVCPISGRRSETLFAVEQVFASRQAHRLTYTSQSRGALERATLRAARLAGRLAGEGRRPPSARELARAEAIAVQIARQALPRLRAPQRVRSNVNREEPATRPAPAARPRPPERRD